MSEVGSASTASANVETFAFVRDLELGALQAPPVATPAEMLRAESATAASDSTSAFALVYAGFSSGLQLRSRAIVAPGDPLMESVRDDDAPEASAAGGHEESGSSAAPQTSSHGAPGAPAGTTSDFAAYALTPQTPSIDSRSERPKRERGRQREPEQREEIEPQKPGYTIDDIVQFAGVTVAERHTQPIDLANRAS